MSQKLKNYLGRERYFIAEPKSTEALFSLMEQEKQQVDCLILQADDELPKLATHLHRQIILLPAVLLLPSPLQEPAGEVGSVSSAIASLPESLDHLNSIYHTAEIHLSIDHLDQIASTINQAIEKFLNLSPTCHLTSQPATTDLVTDLTRQNFILLQQRRLTEKLKERLGYLGVYYKRNPKNFFRHLPLQQQQELLEELRFSYREIILHYFGKDNTPNQKIDDFVNTAFFADIPVSQIVEIHMELMDEFSTQLKLEGRSDEILLDYRLTLIDVIAHLCEMYRRTIPRED
ncbi:MAG: circadian clock protein KaiA [Scytolyngbya sp. HA4215-MV1]|jgi:circadian clock protein KaiA|nr:circadian clock protein KaiA [Scytolyngbya sp. HA4215-MV1]